MHLLGLYVSFFSILDSGLIKFMVLLRAQHRGLARHGPITLQNNKRPKRLSGRLKYDVSKEMPVNGGGFRAHSYMYLELIRITYTINESGFLSRVKSRGSWVIG